MSTEKLTSRLSLLQNKIKRDPSAYKDEFDLQFRHFETEYELFVLKPSDKNSDFCALVSFLSAVTPCYPTIMKGFPMKLISLLELHDSSLNPKVRLSLTKCLTILRNRGFVAPVPLLTLFFKLFRIHDKSLRKLLFSHIVSDIQNVNEKGDNQRINRTMQNFMFTMLEDRSDIASRKSLDVIVELYTRQIWIDARTVNVLAVATLSDKMKVSVGALRFFLGIEEKIAELEEEEDNQEEALIYGTRVHSKMRLHSKKTRAKERAIVRRNKKAKLLRKRLNNKTVEPRFPAIELLYDPQNFMEKLFKKLKGSKDRFEMRLMMMNLISRCIGHHKLILINFYSFIQRYLNSHQSNVTEILAYLVQSCHDLVPPEDMVPLVRTIANNFVTDRCSSEVIAVGLNAIREIFRRIPLIMEEEGIEDLVHDLVQYQSYQERGVRSSARSMINMLREIFPAILRTKDRGKFHAKGAKPLAYGMVKVADGVDGAELLQEEELVLKAAGLLTVQEQRHDNAWEGCSDLEDEDDDDGWSKVEHSDDDEEEEEDIVTGDHVIADADAAGDADSDADADADADVAGEDKEIPDTNTSRIDQHRILTPADFERIRELKDRAQRRGDVSANRYEHKDISAVVAPTDLESYHKQRRRTLEERLSKARAGREEFEHKKKGGGTTNAEKNRKKNFSMVKKSDKVRNKLKRSLQQQQNSVNKRIKALGKVGKNLKRRRT